MTPDELVELRSNASVERWEREIYRLLHGQRDAVLRRVGSAEQHVRIHIDRALDPIASRAAFSSAIARVTQAWQPSSVDEPGFLGEIFTLVRAFTPLEGFAPVLQWLRGWGFQRVSGPDAIHTDWNDVFTHGLSALRAYYPSAPPNRVGGNPAFDGYVSFLFETSTLPRHSGQAFAELMSLYVVEVEHEDVLAALHQWPDILFDLIAWLMIAPRADTPRLLQRLFIVCLTLTMSRATSVDLVSDYFAALRSAGVQISDTPPDDQLVNVRNPDLTLIIPSMPTTEVAFLTTEYSRSMFEVYQLMKEGMAGEAAYRRVVNQP